MPNSSANVFDAVRRGYNDLETSSNAEILEYFSGIEEQAVQGHLGNIKGILFEQRYVEELGRQGIEVHLFEATNHPATDLAIMEQGDIVSELQLKATDSASYIQSTISEYHDIEIVTTSEIAAALEPGVVIDSGIENAALENSVFETLFEDTANPVSPISVFGWFLGLPF